MNVQQSHTDCTPQEPQELTLMDLLNAREDRVRHQKALLNAHPGAVLVSMTLNIPGPVKDSPRFRKALETGLHRLKAMLAGSESSAQEPTLAQVPTLASEPSPSPTPARQNCGCTILHEEFRPLITGPEAYLVLQPAEGCSDGCGDNSGEGYSDERSGSSAMGCSDRSGTDYPLDIKKAAVSVEEGSDLGRLFDIDVLVPGENDAVSGEIAAPGPHDGSDSSHSFDDITGFPRSISRSQLGMKPRRCLLCEEDAKACARSRAHTIEQLLEKIDEILSSAGL